MQCISIQIQPEFYAEFNRQQFLAQVRAVNRSPEIDEFIEKGQHYLQFHFFTEIPKILWQDLQTALYKHSEYGTIISPISIAVYDDEDSKEGFVYLHHCDSNEKTQNPF